MLSTPARIGPCLSAVAIRSRFGAVIELAERDPVIGGSHRLVALVAGVRRIARHLRVTAGAAGSVRGGLDVVAPKRERVIERTLRRR